MEGVLPRVFRQADNPRPSAGDAPAEGSIWLGDVTFERGRRYCIAADSGSGKTSLLAYLTGARRDYDGVISFDGRDIRSLGIADWCRIRTVSIGLLPQELGLFGELTPMENIRIKLDLTGHLDEDRVMAMLRELELPEAALRRPVNRLSVGQQQRVAIVRALCQPFDFLLLDEPVSHLDMECNRKAAAMIAAEAERQHGAVITTSVGNPLLLPDSQQLTL